MTQGLAHTSNTENMCEEVQRVCSGTSDWFVPEPSQKAVQADILIAIRRFKNVVRWKEFWRDQKQSTEPEVNAFGARIDCTYYPTHFIGI